MEQVYIVTDKLIEDIIVDILAQWVIYELDQKK